MQIELPKVTCKYCGHTWVPRVPNPPRCRKCDRYKPLAEEASERKSA